MQIIHFTKIEVMGRLVASPHQRRLEILFILFLPSFLLRQFLCQNSAHSTLAGYAPANPFHPKNMTKHHNF